MYDKVLVAVLWYSVVAAGAGSVASTLAEVYAVEEGLRSTYWTVWQLVSVVAAVVLLVAALVATVRSARRPAGS